jgi:GAF domain-containing protein
MTTTADPLLVALADCAVHVTGALRGWIVVREDERLTVVAGAGAGASALVGRELDGETEAETVRFVVASAQPFAMAPHPDESRGPAGLAGLVGDGPAPLVCVPCIGRDAVIGALEMSRPAGADGFAPDDVALATALAHVAAVALGQQGGGAAAATPKELAEELAQLQASDSERYSHIAAAVSALLGHA